MLEGEGSFIYHNRKGVGTARGIDVRCHMTDEDVLRLLARRCGVGRVYGPYRNGKKGQGWKDRWMFQVCGAKAYNLMKQILPWMCSRRRARIRELMTGYDSVPRKKYRLQNVTTGEIEEVFDLVLWRRKHGIKSDAALWKTMVGQRSRCRGWRRLA